MDRLSLPLFKANLLVMMKHHITQGSRAGRVIDVAHDLCGLHATSSITPYLSLFNRVENFSVGDLNHELYDKKSLLRIRAMRGTLFLVSREMFPVVATATRVSKDTIQSRLLRWHISNAEFRAISKAILSTLAEHAKTLVQIKRDLPPKLSRTMTMSTGSRVLKRTSLDEVLNLMVLEGKIQSQTEPLVWENVKWDGYGLRVFSVIRRVTYSLTRTESHDTLDAATARTQLAELYIKRYGPVAIEDIAWWMGLPRKAVTNIVNSISKVLVKVRIRGLGQDFLLHREDPGILGKSDMEDSHVRLLPYEDPYTKGFKLKRRLIGPNFERIAYPMGNALPTVLLNGRIVGTWSTSIQGKILHLVIRKFVPLDRISLEKIREEGQRIGAFLTPEMPTTVTIEGEKKWREIIAKSRPSFYLTGTPRREKKLNCL